MFRRRAFVAALATTLATAPVVPTAAAPVAEPFVVTGSEAIGLEVLSSIETGVYDDSAAEIVAHDPATQQLFVVNAARGLVDVFDVEDPASPSEVGVLDPAGIVAADGSTIPTGTSANSVAVRDDGLVAVALEAPVKTDDGWAAMFTATGEQVGAVRSGALPDMLTFTPDGSTLLVANEGEPADDYSLDPEGSVSVVDVSGDPDAVTQQQVRTADFRAYDADGGPELPDGVRVFGPDVADADGAAGAGRIARNLEPEYLVLDAEGNEARVILQEANALAVLDVAAAEITSIQPLGTKDHAAPGNGLDASDRDPEDAPTVNVRDWPVQGIYLPDGADSYEVDGETYVLTANEGDAREWGEDTPDEYVEAERIEDLTLCEDSDFGGYVGDDAEFADVGELQEDHNLGRLDATIADGVRDGEGCHEELYSFGARSFAIWDEDGGLVFDSGSDFERITSEAFPDHFNSNHSEANLEGRSDNKGPEPESVAVAALAGRNYAFIGFERVGGVIVYDVTDPSDATFVTYINNRDFTAFEGEDPSDAELNAAGDLGAEGLTVIAAEDSPLPGTPLLAVANEVSGTTTLFTIQTEDDLSPPYDRGIAAACPSPSPDVFVDIDGSVHALAIRCAAAAGVTRGTADPQRFVPRDAVTRGQMASFIARFLRDGAGVALPAGGDAFGDDEGSAHEGAIGALADAGVVEGFGDGRFRHDREVTRAQMASLITRALDLLDEGATTTAWTASTTVFPDSGGVHGPAIDGLAAVGVVQGHTDGSYRPERHVTREQAASFLMRAMDLAVTEGLADPVD